MKDASSTFTSWLGTKSTVQKLTVLGQSVKMSSVELKVSIHTIYSKYCSLDEIVAEVAECFGKSM